MAISPFPKQGQGFRAEVKISENMDLILMVWYGLGYAWGIYDVKVREYVKRESAEDFDDGKAKAEATVRMWYRYTGRKEPFPELNWQETGSGEAGPIAQKTG